MSKPVRLLRRRPNQGYIAGVCAGIAEYLDIDVTLVRAVFVALALVTGGGFIIAYVAMAIVMPSSTQESMAQNIQHLADDMRGADRQGRLQSLFGLGLILFGAWLLVDQLFPELIELGLEYIWPLILILIGIFIATRRKR